MTNRSGRAENQRRSSPLEATGEVIGGLVPQVVSDEEGDHSATGVASCGDGKGDGYLAATAGRMPDGIATPVLTVVMSRDPLEFARNLIAARQGRERGDKSDESGKRGECDAPPPTANAAPVVTPALFTQYPAIVLVRGPSMTNAEA